MSSFVYSSTFVGAPQTGATRDAADCSNVLSALLLDQLFIVGPGFSPVPVQLVAQIVSGKYIDLSELLALNLLQKEPEPGGRLVLTSQLKGNDGGLRILLHGWRLLPSLLSSVEGLDAISAPDSTHLIRHFSGTIWLVYDQAFREHAAATRPTDWLCTNVHLFNFHAARSSVRTSSLAQTTKCVKPPGSSSSAIDCKSWNKGRCTVPFASCRYAHRCSVCSGAHRTTVALTSP